MIIPILLHLTRAFFTTLQYTIDAIVLLSRKSLPNYNINGTQLRTTSFLALKRGLSSHLSRGLTITFIALCKMLITCTISTESGLTQALVSYDRL